MNNKSLLKIRRDAGITLIALVITVIVLLILSLITFNYLLGEPGLFNQAKDAELKMDIASWQERLELAKEPILVKGLGTYDPDAYFQYIEDLKYIEDKNTDVIDNEDGTYYVTVIPGYVFLITLIPTKENPTDAKIEYIGKDGPVIKKIDVTGKDSNSISIEVTVDRLENGKLSYYYKREDETEFHKLKGKQDTTDLTATYTELEQSKVYNIKVIAKNKKGSNAKTINVLTGNLETGNIVASSPIWDASTHTASTTLSTATSLQIQWQKNSISGEWISVQKGQNSETISGLNHNDTIYARLWDGKEVLDEASVTIKDDIVPNIAGISISQTNVLKGTKVAAIVNQTDDQSGVEYSKCKWIFTPSTELDEESTQWENATPFTSKNTPEFTPEAKGSYYLYVLTVDKAGNKKVSKSEEITAKELASDLELNSVRARIATGYTRWLNAVATPSDSTQEFEWTSSNTSVATVDSTGKVTAKVPGTATITVKTKDGTNLSKTCDITVVDGVDVTTLTGIETDNRIAKDSDGNLITVPGGFKVVTGTKATEGIVIQDENLNEYVWVPVDSVSKGTNEKAVDVRLGRYEDFDTQTATGNYTPKQYAENYEQSIGIVTWGGDTFEYASASSGGAGNLKDFVEKTIANGGYFIARYEASINDEKAISKAGKVPSNVAYAIAVETCRATFADSSTVKSDLVNSYAWDTALVYIQKCSNNSGYANQNSLNSRALKTGESGDEICHIYDMASNYYEWSTEECPTATNGNGVYRGGYYGDTLYSPSSVRGFHPRGTDFATSTAQRQILYLTNETLANTTGISVTEPTWNKTSHSASITLSTNSGLQIRYQENSISGWWTFVPVGQKSVTISNLAHGDTIYASLWDGANAISDISVKVEDSIAPNQTNISINRPTGYEVTATVTQSDDQSGVDLSRSKWIFNKISTVLSENSTVWNSATTFSSKQPTYRLTESGNHYLHVLTVDKAGNKKATISNEIKVSATITSTQPTWDKTSHTASITLSTSVSTGSQIRYQINSINGTYTYGNAGESVTITGLNHNDTIYASLWNGSNEEDETSIIVKDSIKPNVTVTNAGVTTNSITVTVQAVDDQWGMPESPIYSFYIKKRSESEYGDAKSTVTNASYTFTGLDQNTNYDIKVTTKDKAENEGIVTLTRKTGTVSGAGSNLTSGSIIASSPTWSGGKARITLSTSVTGMQIQWQKNATTETLADNTKWTTEPIGATSVTVPNLNHGDNIYARLYDGTNAGDSAYVTIRDGQAHKATISNLTSSVIKGNNITATVTHNDNESGINIGSCRWTFTTSANEIGTSETAISSYNGTFSSNPQTINLTANATGYLHVLSVDNAGNKVETISSRVTVALPWDLTKVYKATSEDGITVPVPIGFVPSTINGEKKVAEGFVIKQGNNGGATSGINEFVWVPVPKPEDMFTVDKEGNPAGQLYNFSGTTSTKKAYPTTKNSGYREPDVVTNASEGEDSASGHWWCDAISTNLSILGLNSATEFKTQLQTEFNSMMESVITYKGFYIGRYETGNLSKSKAVVQKNNSDINNQNWYTMYQKSKEIVEGTKAQSTMIWGCQWDACMRWMQTSSNEEVKKFVTDSTGKGNYRIRQDSISKIIPTGSNDSYKVNNIYDMGGNVEEWTIEACKATYRVQRRGQL